MKRIWIAVCLLMTGTGCKDSSSESSSSSHWVKCTTDRQCLAVSGAVACVEEYCVDATGTKVEVDTGGGDVGSVRDPRDPHCDPTQPVEKPVELGDVLLVAESADEQLYVVDVNDGEHRMFRSEGSVLVPLDVIGFGFTNDAGSLSVESPEGWFTLVFSPESNPDQARLHKGLTPNSDLREPDSSTGEALTLQPSSVLSEYSIGPVVSANRVEYHAVSEAAENTLVVIVPERDFAYENLRLFYGNSTEELVERRLTDVARAGDGGSTRLRFSVDGAEAEAYFPVNLNETGLELLPGELTIVKTSSEENRSFKGTLDRRGTALDDVAGFTYACFPTPPNGWRATDKEPPVMHGVEGPSTSEDDDDDDGTCTSDDPILDAECEAKDEAENPGIDRVYPLVARTCSPSVALPPVCTPLSTEPTAEGDVVWCCPGGPS